MKGNYALGELAATITKYKGKHGNKENMHQIKKTCIKGKCVLLWRLLEDKSLHDEKIFRA